MRHFNFLTTFLVIFAFCASSCSEDEDNTPVPEEEPEDTSSGTVGASINGTDWNATTVEIDHYNDMINIGGNEGNYSIGLNLHNTSEAGTTYQVSENSLRYSLYYFEGIQSFTVTNGEIIIDKHDVENRKIEGRFSFSGEDPNTEHTVVVSNGTFTASYPQERE